MRKLALLGLAWVLGLASIGCSSGPSINSSARTAGPGAQGLNRAAQSGSSATVAGTIGNSIASAYKRTAEKASSWAHPAASPPADPIALGTKAGPLDADFYASLARVQEQSQNFAGARELYKKSLELEPDHSDSLLGMARSYDRQGQLSRATELYLDVTRRYPRDPRAFNDLGLCYAKQQMFPQSVAAVGKAIEISPDRPLYRNNMATVLVELGRADEALVHLKQVHTEAIAQYNLGCLLNKHGDVGGALDQFAQAAAKDPSLDQAAEMADSLAGQLDAAELARVGEVDRLPAALPPEENHRGILMTAEVSQRPALRLRHLPAVEGDRPPSRY